MRRLPILSAALALTACGTCGIPESKLKKISPGMTVDQVISIIGQPSRIEHAETTGLQGDTYDYPSNGGEARVIFLNNTVFKAEFVPGAKT
jgi:outer membrane protein assembly factor BamE (lipoprotein component of BamABCDE complex)